MKIRFCSAGRLFTALAAALLLGAACSADPPPPAAKSDANASQGLVIQFRTLAAATEGDNKVEVVVKQPDGKPVLDAQVAVTFRMPAMPSMNMPEMHSAISLESQGDGRYVGTGQLEMTGSWNVAVTVSRNGAQIGSARFALQAK